MKNIRFAYAGLLLSLVWWMAGPLLPNDYEYFALRAVRVEPLLDGLDKTYRLHKWQGITGLVFSVIHWL